MDWFRDDALRDPHRARPSQAQAPVDAEVVDARPASRWADQFGRPWDDDSPLGAAPLRPRQCIGLGDARAPSPLPATAAWPSQVFQQPSTALEPWVHDAFNAPIVDWTDTPPPSPCHERAGSLSPVDPGLLRAIEEDLAALLAPGVMAAAGLIDGAGGQPDERSPALGDNPAPIRRMPACAQPALPAHHAQLSAEGFDHDQLAALSARPDALAWLAENLHALRSCLPDLDPAPIAAIATRQAGPAALEAVLRTMAALRQQGLSPDQVLGIAGSCKAGRALDALVACAPPLCGPGSLGLSPGQVTDLARSEFGQRAVQAVLEFLPALRQAGLTDDQVVAVALRHRYIQPRAALRDLLNSIAPLRALDVPLAQIVAMARETHGSQALAALVRTMPLLRALGLDTRQAMTLAGDRHGRNAVVMVDLTIAKCDPLPEVLDLQVLLDVGKAHGVMQPRRAVRALRAALHEAEWS